MGRWRFSLQFVLVLVTSWAWAFPSNNPDDYDYDKQELVVRQLRIDTDNVGQDYRREHDEFDRADKREDRARKELTDAVDGLRDTENDQKKSQVDLRDNGTEQAKLGNEIQDNKNKLKDLQTQVTTDQGSADRLATLASDAQADADKEASALKPLQDTARNAKKTADDAQSALDKQQEVVEKLQTEYNNAPADKKDEVKQRLDAENGKLPNLLSDRRQTAQAASNAKTAADTQDAKAKSAKSKADTLTTEQKAAQSRLQAAKKAVTDKQDVIKKSEDRVTQLEKREQELKKRVTENQRKIDDYNRSVPRLRQAHHDADREEERSRKQMEKAGERYEQFQHSLKLHTKRLNDINLNIQAGNAEVEGYALNDATADGEREGEEVGNERGEADGKNIGRTDGLRNGEEQGRARDKQQGRDKGIVQGTAEGEAEGKKKADADGNRIGTQQGIDEGKQFAYDTGKSEGWDHGLQTGSDKGAYSKGRGNGEANGLSRAKEDAKPEEPRGYNTREQVYLSAPLKKVTLGALAKDFAGTQGRYSVEGDDRYYNPRAGNYPHARFYAVYNSKYDFEFRRAVERKYRIHYSANYATFYNSYLETARLENLAKDYAGSRKEGFDEKYLPTKDRVKNQTYEALYEGLRQHYRDLAFDKNKDDKTEHARGHKDGTAMGSERKGYDEGDAAAYSKNIGPEKAAAYQAGVDRADALYTKNAVIEVVSLQIIDADNDGIFRPGEKVQTIAVIKNYGLVAKSDLSSEAKVVSGAAQLVAGNQVAQAISGQSETILIGSAQLMVASNATENQSFQVQFRLRDSKKEYKLSQFTAVAKYPALSQIIGFNGILIPGKQADLSVRVTNQSKLAQNLTVTLDADSSKVSIAQASQAIANLAAGASATLMFKVTGLLAAQFEEADIGVVTEQSGLVFGLDNKLATVITPHNFVKTNKGLILSANLARGNGKVLYQSKQLDTWDLRVDGTINNTTALTNYDDKVVHVMADETAIFDRATLNSLSQFLGKGGNLVIWGADQTQSSVGQAFLPMSRAKITQAQNANVTVNGISILHGKSYGVRRLATLTADGSSRPILQVGSDAVGSMRALNGYAEKVPHIYTIAMDPEGLTPAQMGEIFAAIEAANKPFDEKGNLAKTKASEVLNMFWDIQDEIWTAQNDGSKNFYNESPDNNKIFRTIVKLIKESKDTAVRKALADLYLPTLATIQMISRNDVQKSAEFVMNRAPAFLAPTWKKVFCDLDTTKRAECQQNNNGGRK